MKTVACEIDKIRVVVQVVTITSWRSFNDAFEEAGKTIPKTALLWDTQTSHSADRGYELKLYFLEGEAPPSWLSRPREPKPGPKGKGRR